MADTYYDSELTAEEIDDTLKSINGVISQSNNGKVLAIENGKIVPKSVSEWIETTVLEPITINENGDYYPEDTDGFDEVHVQIPQPLLQEKSTTVNGMVRPDPGYYGLSKVEVNVSGGGGGAEIMTRAAWNALTTEQKKTHGYVGIIDRVSGFMRGELVWGSDYVPIGIYLPYSNSANVICEAYVDNFISPSLTWGYGASPVFIEPGLNPSVDQESNSIYVPVKTNNHNAYVDLGAVNTAYTAYIVAKGPSTSAFSRIMSAMADRYNGNGMLMFGPNVIVSSWASDTSFSPNVNIKENFVALAISYGGGTNFGAAYNRSIITKTPSQSGRYLTIGRTDIDASTYNAEPNDLYLRYFAVVNEGESQETVLANLAYLHEQFETAN